MAHDYNQHDMAFYNKNQTLVGDFDIDPETGDFRLTEDYEAARQDATNRIRTQRKNWRSHAFIGANLELLIGEHNTAETGLRAKHAIEATLFADRRFHQDDTTVFVVPTEVTKMEGLVQIETEDGALIVGQPIQL